MNHQELFKLLRTVHNNVRCPQCGKKYQFSDISVRGVVDSVCFLEMKCRDHMPLLATVLIQNKPELLVLAKNVNPNDVIETHKFLKEFKGDFKKIFKSE